MTKVTLQTNLGNITLELDEINTPMTTENFLAYVRNGFFDQTIFHRVIKNFMIQGGGFTDDMQQKTPLKPIANEAKLTTLKNNRGTISMARTQDPHSATSQFFINAVDNQFLNYRNANINEWGYCAFGHVIAGMDIVDKIILVPTTSRQGHQDVPIEEVYIEKAYVEEEIEEKI